PEWLRAVSVSDVECRSLTCRVEWTWPASVAASALKRGEQLGLRAQDSDPIQFISESGFLATISKDVGIKRTYGSNGLDSEQATYLLVFDRDDVSPDSYAAWAATTAPAAQAAIQQIVKEVEDNRDLEVRQSDARAVESHQ